MNKDLTLVFSSYQSQHLLKKIAKKFYNKYKIIIIENSCNEEIKKFFESKFKDIRVIIPKENLGLAKSYNLGIKNAKTRYVFLNNPDLEISYQSIKNLLICAKNIKNFGVISPTYKNEKNYKNYELLSPKKNNFSKIFKRFNIIEVDSIDNNFLIDKKNLNNILFDENFFLYFETIDFTKNLSKKQKKLLVAKKIKFHHHSSSSLPQAYNNLVNKTRAFHYNWSKFYYCKKNFSYLFALRKIFPNIVKSFKRLILSLFKLDFENFKISLIEILGIFTSIFGIKSFYRPKN
jgi:N-acetylglucosaminyl-diphospho-decaprenol L-rhamnosyltransferase